MMEPRRNAKAHPSTCRGFLGGKSPWTAQPGDTVFNR